MLCAPIQCAGVKCESQQCRGAAGRPRLRVPHFLAQAQRLHRKADGHARDEQLAEQQQRIQAPALHTRVVSITIAVPQACCSLRRPGCKHKREAPPACGESTWKIRMPPEKVATAETTTSKSREISGCTRRSWYRNRPPATRLMPSSSAGLKSTFTMALVPSADAHAGPLPLLPLMCILSAVLPQLALSVSAAHTSLTCAKHALVAEPRKSLVRGCQAIAVPVAPG